jgi:GntR family transcriptional regulator
MPADASLVREGVPLYLQIKTILTEELRRGKWKPGDQLPTEPELSAQFGVSGGTVRQAVIALVKEGQLRRRSGKGTFVAKPRVEESFDRFFRFKRGAVMAESFEIAVHAIDVQPANELEVRHALGLSKGGRVLRIHRTIARRGVAICHYVSYLPFRQFPGVEPDELRNHGLYDVLERKFGVHVVRATEVLHARQADAKDALFLGVKKGEPVIAINRTAYTYHDRPIEFRKATGRTDKFFYQVELR